MAEGVQWGADAEMTLELDNIHDAVRKWDTFYLADHSTIEDVFEYFKKRCIRPDRHLEIAGFVYRNKIRPIVQKRAEAIPAWFRYEVSEEARNAEDIANWLDKWVQGPFFGDGANLWQSLGTWNLWLERHGNLILRLSTDEEGNVHVTRVHPLHARVLVDPKDVTQIKAWLFSWEVTGRDTTGVRKTQKITEFVGDSVYWKEVDGERVEENTHNLGFIPVVHVAINKDLERYAIWGKSVIEDLIEPQLWLAASMTTIREVCRWSGWPAFAGSQLPTAVDLRPGGYTLDEDGSLRALTWSTNMDGLYREMEEHLQDLYEAGRVARKSPDMLSATGRLPSGKAMLVLTQDGIQYVKGVVNVLEEAMSELLSKAVALAGLAEYNPKGERLVTVVYPPLELEDDDTKLAKARLVMEAWSRGLLPKRAALQTLLDLDVVSTAQNVDELLEELAQEEAAQLSGLALEEGGEETEE